MSLNQTKTLALAALCAVSFSSIRADDFRPLPRGEAVARARMLAPFLDDQTIVVARFDLSQIAGDKLADFAELLWPAKTLREEKRPNRTFLEDFKRAGGCDLYLVANLNDVPEHSPLVVVPLCKEANEKALSAALTSLPYETCERKGDVLFCGSQLARRRLANAAPTARPELQRALEEAGDTQFQIVLMPSLTVRRVAEELMPVLPKGLGGGQTRGFTRGALWVALGGNLSPRPSVRVAVQSEDESSATALRAQWQDLLLRAWPQGAALIPALTPEVQKNRLLLDLDAGKVDSLIALLRPELQAVSRFSRRQQSVDHLKQIGLAMHTYWDVHKHLPSAALVARDGKPLLSWRVAILPYLGQEALFKEFHLDEAWDSEHNRKLVDRMPDVYRSLDSTAGENRTCYAVAVGQGSVFEGNSGLSMRDITDGTSNTLMAVEVGDDQAVIWSKPDDFSFDSERPSAGLTSPYPDGKLLLFCDGSVHFVRQSLDDETLRRILIRNDGQPVPALE
jgi:hypothetical protein